MGEIAQELTLLYFRKSGVLARKRFVFVRWCVECPPNCISCTYNDTAEATMCQHCDYEYEISRSDGQCYGKYFVSDGPTNITESTKLAFGQ